jgi:hypothetical protein
MDPERCTSKADQTARSSWIASHIKQIDECEDVKSPNVDATRDEAMEIKAVEEDAGRTGSRARQAELPPSELQLPTRSTPTYATVETPTTSYVTPHVVVSYLRFGTPDPPTAPHKARNGTLLANVDTMGHQNRFKSLR